MYFRSEKHGDTCHPGQFLDTTRSGVLPAIDVLVAHDVVPSFQIANR